MRDKNQGFTLIELLIVTVVVVSLMAIVFRLTGIAGSASNRETTVYRLQCLENCLSGYYAAFGSYPPVPLQGATRNIYRKTGEDHPTIQSDDPRDIDESTTKFNAYSYVDAACRAQPVAAMFPPPGEMSAVVDGRSQNVSSAQAYESFQQAVQAACEAEAYSEGDMAKINKWRNSTFQDIGNGLGFLTAYKNETDSTVLQLFRYGLMSFLLPRYRFMIDFTKERDDNKAALGNFKQWTEFNPLPPRMDTGIAYESWKEFCKRLDQNDDEGWQIDLIPSQAACARWMPNLKDIVEGPDKTFFGVKVGIRKGDNGIPDVKNAASFTLYSAGGRNSSASIGYPLLSLTVRDGWGRDFYYYSPAPYQTYVLWSAGANGRTFPPWIDLEQFRRDHADQYETAVQWMSDDIKFMSTGK